MKLKDRESNFKSIFDSSTPGFGYSNSDLKNNYLTAEQLNSRQIAPSNRCRIRRRKLWKINNLLN